MSRCGIAIFERGIGAAISECVVGAAIFKRLVGAPIIIINHVQLGSLCTSLVKIQLWKIL